MKNETLRPIDQGIGGTGAPLRHLADAVPIDQGIGGTGITPTDDAMRPGTSNGRLGVVGVITGFASVCVDGLEIAYDASTTVKLDGALTTRNALRAGQVVVLDASGGITPHAASIAVRHEVTGPVEHLEAGFAMVAGQRVRLSDSVWGTTALQRGAWVSVSGLRDQAGVVQATRIDPSAPGPVTVRGQLVPGVIPHIGLLAVRASPFSHDVPVGGDVEAIGRYMNGSLLADSVAPDLLARDPVAYFGAAVDHYVVETYATSRTGGLQTGNGLQAAYHGPDVLGGRRVIALSRNLTGGGLVVTKITDVAPSPGSARLPMGDGAGAKRPAGSQPGSAGGSGSQDSIGGGARANTPGGDARAFAPAPMPSASIPQGGSGPGGGFDGGASQSAGSPRGYPSANAPSFSGGQGLSGGQRLGGGGRPAGP
ncbi:MAG: DUF5666 domain-containing protein [Janthinobacterium lividum]